MLSILTNSIKPISLALPLHERKKILIVDDIPSKAKLMKKLLSKYDCTIAFSGKEALLKVNEILPDLILLDVVMPDMDGFEVCTQMKVNPKFKNIPIIMVTALGDRQSKLKGLKVGINEFLTKPIMKFLRRIRVSDEIMVIDVAKNKELGY